MSLADGAPFLMTSESSLADLNGRLAKPLPMDRFRPNIVISGSDPFVEDTWASVRIGDIYFPVVFDCDRCSITTVDQKTAEKGVEPLRALAKFRKRGSGVFFGTRMIPEGNGRIRIGDTVQVLTIKPNSL